MENHKDTGTPPTGTTFTRGRFWATAAWYLVRGAMWSALGLWTLFAMHPEGLTFLVVTVVPFCLGIFFLFYPFYLYFRWDEEAEKWRALTAGAGYLSSYAELWRENKLLAVRIAFFLLVPPVVAVVFLVVFLIMD
jgi:hypothetical protein